MNKIKKNEKGKSKKKSQDSIMFWNKYLVTESLSLSFKVGALVEIGEDMYYSFYSVNSSKHYFLYHFEVYWTMSQLLFRLKLSSRNKNVFVCKSFSLSIGLSSNLVRLAFAREPSWVCLLLLHQGLNLGLLRQGECY